MDLRTIAVGISLRSIRKDMEISTRILHIRVPYLSMHSIRQIETGRREMSFPESADICKALGISLEAFASVVRQNLKSPDLLRESVSYPDYISRTNKRYDKFKAQRSVLL